MGKSTKSAADETKRPPRLWLLWAIVFIVAVAAAIWAPLTLINGARRDTVLARMPVRPDLKGWSEKLTLLLDQAELGIHEGPLGPGVGRLGNVYQASYFFDEAEACYELAMELEPGNAQWPYFLAFVRQMGGETGSVLSLLDRTLELSPRYVPALLRRGDIQYKIGNIEAAQADYRRCQGFESTSAYAHLGLARIAIDLKHWDEAEEYLGKALRADPAFGVAHRLMASVHGHFGRPEELQKELERAEACGRFFPAPDPWIDALVSLSCHTENLLGLAFMAANSQREERARALYEQIISIDPDDGEAYWRLGAILRGQGEPAKAEKLFRKTLELGTKDETRYPVIHNNLGEILFRRGRIDEAIDQFELAVKQDPEFGMAHTNLGAAFTKLGHPEQAITHCKKALSIDPESHKAQYNWGLALLKLNQAGEAAGHFSRAARLNPDFAAAHYQLGVFFGRDGDHEQAAKHFRQALDAAEAAGNHAFAKQLRALLARAGR